MPQRKTASAGDFGACAARLRAGSSQPPAAARARSGRLRAAACVLAVCLLCGLLAGCGKEEAQPPVVYATTLGDVRCAKNSLTQDGYILDSRVYTYEDGSIVSMVRLIAEKDQNARQLADLRLTGENAELCVYDAESAVWKEQPLTPQTLKSGTYLLRTDDGETFIVTPQCYRPQSNGMLEWLPDSDGSLRIEAGAEGGFDLFLEGAAQPAGTNCEYLIVTADRDLFDLKDASLLLEHGACQFSGDHRWCMDGYYYRSPATYYPSGENYFYRNPAAYETIIMMRDTQPISEVLGPAMMDVLLGNQTASGFIPVLAGSEWLRDEYGIGPGYYDTRWNSDFWVGVVNGAERYGLMEWLAAAKDYAEYYENFAKERHFVLTPEDLQRGTDPQDGEEPAEERPAFVGVPGQTEGWLVQDYNSRTGNGQKTHASLNHQTAEASFLYRLAQATGRDRYAETADLLVQGIALSADGWIREDGDLWYCYLPNGTYDRTDYPVLTYDDLCELQSLYTARHGSAQPELQRLIDSKYAWMQSHGY